MRKMVADSEPFTIIAIHNHPSGYMPSMTDLNAAYKNKYKYGIIARHNGKVLKYSIKGEYNEVIADIFLDKVNKFLYNSSGMDYVRLQEVLADLAAENVVLEVFET